MQAVAVSFDIQNSRAYSSKEQLLTDLHRLADQLNRAFPAALVPFQIKSGDSLLGVFNEYAVSYPLMLMLLNQPLNGYIGIGFGQYETLSTTHADEANGSAIIFAFEAQEAAKQTANRISFAGPPYLPTALLNGYIEMLYPGVFRQNGPANRITPADGSASGRYLRRNRFEDGLSRKRCPDECRETCRPFPT